MNKIPAIAIFDIGKTNKKLFLFDEQYRILFERSVQLEETTDEDGFPCENIQVLTDWVKDSLAEVMALPALSVKAINFSTYGASFVLVDAKGIPVAPLYNYLKPFPETLKKPFYDAYGGEINFSRLTASPVLGNLNSGLQLYYLKYEKPQVFEKIKHALHLPQYLSNIITHQPYTDITSIGCHTALWNFEKNNYHDWVSKENIIDILSPIKACDEVIIAALGGIDCAIGIGLHDSSAALIPYLSNFTEPFVLLSTGTWCISLNPFNQTPLTEYELKNDCLCFLEYHGKPVKASRLFAGYEHEQQTKRLAEYFHVATDHYKTVTFDTDIIVKPSMQDDNVHSMHSTAIIQQSVFEKRKLSGFDSYATAYHQLILDIMALQVHSTNLVIDNSVRKIFVDGGFSKNAVYMHLLAVAFPHIKVYAATVAQASAIGAALAIHHHWNKQAAPTDLIELNYYTATHDLAL